MWRLASVYGPRSTRTDGPVRGSTVVASVASTPSDAMTEMEGAHAIIFYILLFSFTFFRKFHVNLCFPRRPVPRPRRPFVAARDRVRSAVRIAQYTYASNAISRIARALWARSAGAIARPIRSHEFAPDPRHRPHGFHEGNHIDDSEIRRTGGAIDPADTQRHPYRGGHADTVP